MCSSEYHGREVIEVFGLLMCLVLSVNVMPLNLEISHGTSRDSLAGGTRSPTLH